MGLEVDSDIFKWLQLLKIVKEGKRTLTSTVQLSPQVANKFYDGLYITNIVKLIFKQRNELENIVKLESIKQNSTPAIRLYNWNLLTDALKKLGYTLDYNDKSKILNLEPQPINKILYHLYSVKPDNFSQELKKKLQVDIAEINKKTLSDALNIFQFLVISISKHFKLSVQHTLNLFLDNNKYLAHLLVKGVKNSFEPILLFLGDISTHIEPMVVNLFCIDQEESVIFFFNAIKPCLISKQDMVAQKCIEIIKQMQQVYLIKNMNLNMVNKWMQNDGVNTMLFGLKRHPHLSAQIISLCFSYLDIQFFNFIEPSEKSVIWSNQIEKLTFISNLLRLDHPDLINKFLNSPTFQQWSKYCTKALKKSKSTDQLCLLINIFQKLWFYSPAIFEQQQSNLPNSFVSFLKNCSASNSDILFYQSVRSMFSLMQYLGQAKNSYAPLLYKTLISCLSFQTHLDRIDFLIVNFDQILRSIPQLPGSPLVQSLINVLHSSPNIFTLKLVRLLLEEQRINQQESIDIIEVLAKILFYNIQLGTLATDCIFSYFSTNPQQEADQNRSKYSKLCLAQIYAFARQIFRSFQDLKSDYRRYSEEQAMKKGDPSFLKYMGKYLLISNLISFIKKSIFASNQVKDDLQASIFHTYIKIKEDIHKNYIANLLIPLLKNYEDVDQQLQLKILDYQNQAYPKFSYQSLQNLTPKVQKLDQNDRSKQSIMFSSIKSEKSSPLNSKHILAVNKNLQKIKQKKQQQVNLSLVRQKQKDLIEQKKELYRSLANEKRIIQFGKKNASDITYKQIHDFDSIKVQENQSSILHFKLFHLNNQEQVAYIEDLQSFMKRYRKIWRFLFFKYSSLYSLKEAQTEEKINMAQVWKMLKQYEFDIIKKQQSHMMVKKVNQMMKRKNDLQNLTYLGFEQYLLQICHFGYNRYGYSHLPPALHLKMFIDQIRGVTGSRGGSTEMFDSPDDVYFQQTEVIREFNRRLKQNPDYILPQGYKKVKQTQLTYHYGCSEKNKGLKNSYLEVLQILDNIFASNKSLGFRLIQPTSSKQQKCLAKPALFQKLNQKLKQYKGGYLMPKRQINSTYLKDRNKISPVKIQFHPLINFSLGIKLGLASVDIRLRYIADEVAYWMDDMLDAVEQGKLKVQNKAKKKIQNQIIRRKRSSAYQQQLEKLQLEKKQRIRAETVKHEAQRFRQKVHQTEAMKKKMQRLQRKDRKEKQQKQMKKKMQQFEEAKNKLLEKRNQVKNKKQQQIQMKKKQKEQYNKKVDEYFKKKKEQLEQKERNMKLNREHEIKKEQQAKLKQIQKKKKLEISIFKKQEEVLQKIIETKQTYEEAWKSQNIQRQIQSYRPRLKLVFDLLLKYQKSKISATTYDEICFNTLNFFMIKWKLLPLIDKNNLTQIFKNTVRNKSPQKAGELGLNFQMFEELLFKFVVKIKHVLNKSVEQKKQISEENEVEEPNQKDISQLSPTKKQKKTLTDEYTLDASGVTNKTIKKLMEYLQLPYDKQSAEQQFRQFLETSNNKPATIQLKQIKSYFELN